MPQRMALLAARAAGDLLLMCPRAVLEFAELQPAEGEAAEGEAAEGAAAEGAAAEGAAGGGAEAAGEADAYRHHEALRGPWDRQMRSVFSGAADVRRHAKDRLLLVQARPTLALARPTLALTRPLPVEATVVVRRAVVHTAVGHKA